MITKTLLTTGAAALFLGVLSASAGTVDFEAKVLPIFKERCFDCHSKEHTDPKTGKPKKVKGKLRLDGAEFIKKGGADGGEITPGDPSKSTIYTSVTLPDSDDKCMPPKGDRLTKEQTDLIKTWITEGAEFGAWKGAAD